MAEACRSCGAPLIWARTEKSRWLPLDAEPVTARFGASLFVLRERDQPKPLAVAIPPTVFPDEPAYQAHFATCPHADKWRGAKARAERELDQPLS